MGEDSRSLLEEEIKNGIKHLKSLSFGSEEHSHAVETLGKLYKLKLDEDKNDNEHMEKMEYQETDHDFKRAQLDEAVKDRYFRLGMAVAELVLPLMFYGIWMSRGFKFEENGTFTSQTFRNLFSRFKPTKK